MNGMIDIPKGRQKPRIPAARTPSQVCTVMRLQKEGGRRSLLHRWDDGSPPTQGGGRGRGGVGLSLYPSNNVTNFCFSEEDFFIV